MFKSNYFKILMKLNKVSFGKNLNLLEMLIKSINVMKNKRILTLGQ